LGKFIFGWACDANQIIISNNLLCDSRLNFSFPTENAPTLNRFLGIPILKEGKLIGAIGILNSDNPYTETDADFLKPLTSLFSNFFDWVLSKREKRSWEWLKESSEKLDFLISENIPDIVTLHDLELRIIFASQSIERITGLKPSELLGKDIFQTLDYSFTDPQNFNEFAEYSIPYLLKREGRVIHLELTWTPLYNNIGEVVSYQAVTKDVSERENQLKDLRKLLTKEMELNQLNSNFIAVTSHEVRTPLATIQSSTDLMDMIIEGINDENLKASLNKQILKINRQIGRLSTIISDESQAEKKSVGNLP
jgi:PAS domain S-box-containing protein